MDHSELILNLLVEDGLDQVDDIDRISATELLIDHKGKQYIVTVTEKK